MNNFTINQKKEIESDIKKDFDKGYLGIKMLPEGSKLGVYVAYLYNLNLFKKIKSLNYKVILEKRIRISNSKKIILMIQAFLLNKFGTI